MVDVGTGILQVHTRKVNIELDSLFQGFEMMKTDGIAEFRLAGKDKTDTTLRILIEIHHGFYRKQRFFIHSLSIINNDDRLPLRRLVDGCRGTGAQVTSEMD